jgi:hypothetical protein
MEKLALEYQDEKSIHIIWDNLNIHKDGHPFKWVFKGYPLQNTN